MITMTNMDIDDIESIYGSEFNIPTKQWRTGILEGAYYYFTMFYNNEQKIVFIKDPQAFDDMFVVLGSTPRRNDIISRVRGQLTVQHAFLCADCRKREHDCGPHSMYNIVYNGQPKVVCSDCLTVYNTTLNKYSSDYEAQFFELLFDETYATVRTVNMWDDHAERAENFIPPCINFQYEKY